MKRKAFKVVIILISMFLIWISYFTWSTITQLSSDRITKVVEQEASKTKSLIESGSLVNLKQITLFEKFTIKEVHTQKFLSKNTINKNLMNVNEDFELNQLLKNDCKDVYCIQKNMAFEKIPSLFWKGLIGIEDYRFLEHFGIDFKAIARAVVKDIIAMKFVQGGSTLTQQLVKNLYFENKKTLSRKLKEVIAAIYIESNLSKEEILELYFNKVYWGSHFGLKIRGINAATLIYFGKRPSDITPYESALLIGMLKGPGYYSPKRVDKLRRRTNIVFNKLVELNLLPNSQRHRWTEDQWSRFVLRFKNRDLKDKYLSLWWVTSSKPQYLNEYEQYVFAFNAFRLLNKIKESRKKSDLAIKGYFGDITDPTKKFYFYSKLERNRTKAIEQEPHQVGSSLKPIVYKLFLELGAKLTDEVETKSFELKLPSGKWAPRESHHVPEKRVTLKKALLDSLNRPFIRKAADLGFDKIEKGLIEYIPELQKPLSHFPAQLLGAVELSLSEIYMAYSKFIVKECRQVFENTIIHHLSDPMTTTVKKIARFPLSKMRFFGKTGTSNNGHDNWYTFFDGRMLGVLWFGQEGQNKQKDLRLYGGTTSFKVFQNFMIERGRRFTELSCENLLDKK